MERKQVGPQNVKTEDTVSPYKKSGSSLEGQIRKMDLVVTRSSLHQIWVSSEVLT